jgi:hypothetical protein
MKMINTKLVLSALGIALLVTPALAQSHARQVSQNDRQFVFGGQTTGSGSNTFERNNGYYRGE